MTRLGLQRFQASVIIRATKMLSPADVKKIFGVLIIQVFLGLLDLLGVALVGILGALAIQGISANGTGNRVQKALEILNLNGESIQHQAVVIGSLAALFLICKTASSIFLLRKVVFFLSRRSAHISSNLVRKVLSQPLVNLQSRSIQQTLYAVTWGVDEVTMGILITSVYILSDVVLLVIMGAGLFLVDFNVASVTLIVFSLIAWCLHRLMKAKALQLGQNAATVSIANSEKITEVLNSYREIVVKNRRSYYSNKIGGLRMQLADINAERSFLPNVSKFAIEIAIVLIGLTVGAMQFLTSDARHALGVLTVFLAASTRIAPAILRLQQGALYIKSSAGSAGLTLDLFEELQAVNDIETYIPKFIASHDGFNPRVHLENTSVQYPDEQIFAIKNLSLDILEGSFVALVGPSGSGKSTLVDLILGILEPVSGSVVISGQKPHDAINLWPGAIGYVPQDVIIVNASIRDNVTLGYDCEEVSDLQVWEALRIAQIEDFVRSLPEGLNTHLGDRGSRISGGQRQRIGIARAVISNPSLLILDEATSALDGETEAAITEAVKSLRGSMTVLVIAHRLSTIREADIIHYIEDGVLVASGDFNEIRRNVVAFDQQASGLGL